MGAADLPLEMAVWLPVVQACVDRIRSEPKPKKALTGGAR